MPGRSQSTPVLLALAGALLLSTGCAAKRTSGLTEEAPAAAAAPAEGEADRASKAEALWAQRAEIEPLRQAITEYEAAFQADPGSKKLAAQLSRAWYLLGDAHLTDPEEKLQAYEKGTWYGDRALALNPEFKAKIDAGTPEEEAYAVLGAEDVDGLYWRASALGKWSRAKGFSTVVKNKNAIKAMVERVTALEPTYLHGAPDRYWGAFYAVAPSFAGGDLNLSRQHFDKALEISPDNFTTKVLMAEVYAPKVQDPALFDRLLDEVLAGDPNVIPELAPEFTLEQKKAQALKAQKGDLFVE